MTRESNTAVLFDLDSTTCDTRHRWDMLPHRNPDSDWSQYAMQCDRDVPVEGTRRIIQLLWPYHQMHACSMRAPAALDMTKFWLTWHHVPFDEVYLAPGDVIYPDSETATRASAEHKIRYIETLEAQGIEVVLFLEDNSGISKIIWERKKIPVMTVNAYDNEEWKK